KRDPDDAPLRLLAPGKRFQRIDGYIRGQQNEADADQFKRPALEPLCVVPALFGAQSPEQYSARRCLDERVNPESHQRDASADRTATDRDASLDDVPADRQVLKRDAALKVLRAD